MEGHTTCESEEFGFESWGRMKRLLAGLYTVGVVAKNPIGLSDYHRPSRLRVQSKRRDIFGPPWGTEGALATINRTFLGVLEAVRVNLENNLSSVEFFHHDSQSRDDVRGAI